jgi:S-adenosylmethionine synthetase
MGVYVNTFGTAKVDERKIEQAVIDMFDFRPRALVETLDLLRPIYRPTAAYGHFGRTEKPGFFTWEKTDRAAELKDRLFGGKVSSKAAKSEAPKAKASKAEPKAEAKNGAKADAKKGAKKAKESRAEA